jgi:hypothetical protein
MFYLWYSVTLIVLREHCAPRLGFSEHYVTQIVRFSETVFSYPCVCESVFLSSLLLNSLSNQCILDRVFLNTCGLTSLFLDWGS